MRLSTALPALLGFGAVAKIQVPAVQLVDGGLARRQFLDGKVCRFFQQKSLLVNDNQLYIDFSYMTMVDNYDEPKSVAYLVQPFYYNLSKPAENLESFSMGGSGTTSFRLTKHETPNKKWKVPPIIGGALYFSGRPKSKIVKYGGHYSDYRVFNSSRRVGKNEWWTLDNDSGEWATITPKGSKGLLRAEGMASVNVPAQGLAFSIGGYFNSRTDSTYTKWNLTAGKYFALRSMLIYNTRKHQVKNVTISPLPAQWGGVVEYVPIGKKGVLVLIGGYESKAAIISRSGNKLKDMKKVHLYDIHARKWYTQITQGAIPSNRAFACASVASAPDNSSYNIFVHGGTGGSALSYSDTYVLSLPSFEWIEADSGFDTQSRMRHDCHMTTKHKMIVIGGHGQDQDMPSKPSWDNGVCDKYAVMNVFDTNTMRWQDSWDPNDGSTKFKVNKVITAVIGGNENGGAIFRKPGQGWGSEAVQKLFETGEPPDEGLTPATTQESYGNSGVSHAVVEKVGTVGLISLAVIVAAMVA